MSLSVKNLSISLSKRLILQNIGLEITKGTVTALMGPNGSGKSTLAKTLMGITNQESGIRNYQLRMDGRNIRDRKPDERARLGLFLAFQNPIAIGGVNVANLLRTAFLSRKDNQRGKVKPAHNPALNVWDFNKMLVEKAKLLHIPKEFLGRYINEDFSGGEKKKMEMLQALILKPKYAIFDEIDTGLDIDSLKIVALGILELKKQNTGILIITHYLRILKYLKPDFVRVLINGRITASGGYKLAQKVEENGYGEWTR